LAVISVISFTDDDAVSAQGYETDSSKFGDFRSPDHLHSCRLRAPLPNLPPRVQTAPSNGARRTALVEKGGIRTAGVEIVRSHPQLFFFSCDGVDERRALMSPSLAVRSSNCGNWDITMIFAGSNDRNDLPRLARIDPRLFDLLFVGCKVERYAAGQHLFVQEDDGDRIYGVMSGTVEISLYSPGGQKLVANIELSRSLVGEIGALDGHPRTATAICLAACELVSLSRTQLFDRIEKNPPLARAMIELLCARLRWISGELGDQAFFGIEARLAKRLAFLAGVMADGSGWIPISQSELGEFLGVTRESVNKTLNDWRSRSIIDIKRGGLRITNARALRHIAESQDDD
jgi:CRP/FNR family transcriptional regulator, cyclic AMP receptor protein